MKITWFGHSAFRLDFAGKAVLIDPFFTGNPAFEGDKAKISRASTHILLTHGHGDHVGEPSTSRRRPAPRSSTNSDLCMYWPKQGLENFDPMNTGGTTDQGGFTVTLVRADHSAALVEMGVELPLGKRQRRHRQGAGRADRLSHGRHRHFRRHGADRRDPSAGRGDRADRRPLHHGSGDRGAGGPALSSEREGGRSPAITAPSRSIEPNADRFVAALEGTGVQVVVPHKTVAVTVRSAAQSAPGERSAVRSSGAFRARLDGRIPGPAAKDNQTVSRPAASADCGSAGGCYSPRQRYPRV